MTEDTRKIQVERTGTGAQVEKRLLKLLKALAELKDTSLGDCSKASSCTHSRESVRSPKRRCGRSANLEKIYGLETGCVSEPPHDGRWKAAIRRPAW